MTPLSQEMLEKLLANKMPQQADYYVIYFTAKWCGPCNALPLDKMVQLDKKINWLLCDVDDNTYTPGYCQVRTLPSFLAIVRAKPLPLLSTSNSIDIYKWMHTLTAPIPRPPK